MTVYASTRGGRYHADSACGLAGAAFRGLPDEWPAVTLAAAKERRLTPCRTCDPPPLLTLVREEAKTLDTVLRECESMADWADRQ